MFGSVHDRDGREYAAIEKCGKRDGQPGVQTVLMIVAYQIRRIFGRNMIRWNLVVGILGLLAVSLQADAQSALSHTSGNVAVAVTDFGSLGAVRESTIAPNFRFPKSDGRYYLYERSEIWVGDRNGNVANTWEWDSQEEQWSLGEWSPTEGGRITGHVDRDGRQIITAQFAPSGTEDFPPRHFGRTK